MIVRCNRRYYLTNAHDEPMSKRATIAAMVVGEIILILILLGFYVLLGMW